MSPSHVPRSGFIEVEGVRLQTLDWGGDGPALVFLAGYANTPHFFDSVARAFSDRFRVLGLTRRAHGDSAQPETGYDVPTLASDIVGFLDAFDLESASFAGHSFAGHEMCCLASDHAPRVEKLVFFDTLYDYTEEDLKLLAENPLPSVEPPPETYHSVAAYCDDFVARYPAYRPLRSPRWDELWALSLERTPQGRFRERIRPETAKRLFEGRTAYRPGYATIRCPALAFFAFQDERWFLPEDASEGLRRAMAEHLERVNAQVKRRCIDRIRREIADVRVVEFADTSHYCFLDREREVVEEMKQFLR